VCVCVYVCVYERVIGNNLDRKQIHRKD
jgi:hypothetical protein